MKSVKQTNQPTKIHTHSQALDGEGLCLNPDNAASVRTTFDKLSNHFVPLFPHLQSGHLIQHTSWEPSENKVE